MSVNSTNPGTLFGGSWEAIENTFLVAQGSSFTAGSTGGTMTHTHTTNTGTTGGTAITTAQMPAHTHTRGTMEISGAMAPAHSAGICWYNVALTSGAFYTSDSATNCGKPSLSGTFTGDHVAQFRASRSWTGATSSVGSGSAHTHSQSSVSTSSGNNLPPYMAVYMWKRTA